MADLDGLWPPFHTAVTSMLADAEGRALGLYVVSGFRSIAIQTALWNAELEKVRRENPGKSEAWVTHEAAKWVAPPGHSNHGPKVDAQGHEPGKFGRAVDLGMPGVLAVSGKWPPATKQRVDALAARFGLRSPMSWEDWHYEPGPNFVAPNWTPTEAQAVNKILEPVSSVPFPGKAASGWVFGRRGHVYAFGGAGFFGGWDPNTPGPDNRSGRDCVALVPTLTGNGYWLVSDAGEFYGYGAAQTPEGMNYKQEWGSTNDLPIVGGFANARGGVDLIRIDCDVYSLPVG